MQLCQPTCWMLVLCYSFFIILFIDFNRMHIDVIEFLSSPSFHMASNCFVNPQGETDTYEETRLSMTAIKAIVLRFDNSNRNRKARTVVQLLTMKKWLQLGDVVAEYKNVAVACTTL